MSASAALPPVEKKRINLRSPEVMAEVLKQVQSHYRSQLVDRIIAQGGVVSRGGLTVRLAQKFGFCYGVERAIDMAYAARKYFPSDVRIYIIGEIIHNPEVNEQIAAMGIINLVGQNREPDLTGLTADDVVILPAFGAETKTINRIKEIGCHMVDTTCGDVMSVWRRVRDNAKDAFTSIIHGKAEHEETRATASRALGPAGGGHYLVVLTLADTDYVCDYIRHGGNKEEFFRRFGPDSHSVGFDPDLHLSRVGVANQTTMLRGETEEVQRRIRAAVLDRDGATPAVDQNFRQFDTICGATQERQDALFDLLRAPMDLMLVVGGYNSSNTSHLAEIGEQKLPTYFIRNAARLETGERITHYNLHAKKEQTSEGWLPVKDQVVVGVTAGASCPNHLIEETILRLFELKGIPSDNLA